MRPRLTDIGLGLGYLVLGAALVVAAVLAYDRAFVRSTDVALHTGPVGNQLQKGSDVKLNGVPIGQVSAVRAVDGGAVVTLALQPAAADELPRATTARLLPKTLFGERYVSLLRPAGAPATGLADGDAIRQDTSDETVELEEVFDDLLPVLQAIQPEKLAATLGELSTTLRGRGEKIGDTLVTLGDYLRELDPHVPQMLDDLERLGSVADTYGTAAPDLLDALDALTTTSRTLVQERSSLQDVYARVIDASDTTRGWVSDNQQTIEVLADESRAALEAVRPYAKQFPCLFASARKFIPEMDEALGEGTDEPGLHVRLDVVESRGKYLVGADDVRWASGKGPRCPYVTGEVGTSPASASAAADEPRQIGAPPTRLPAQLAAARGLGAANSPAENEMIAELVAPTQGLAPSDYPQWGSLLLGPVLRGTKVVVR